jgi:hypothetical protein
MAIPTGEIENRLVAVFDCICEYLICGAAQVVRHGAQDGRSCPGVAMVPILHVRRPTGGLLIHLRDSIVNSLKNQLRRHK